jgi:peptidoglycan/xylan/chitin deacetylase (PgdA/CDA1 family)
MAKILLFHRVLPKKSILEQQAYSTFGTVISEDYFGEILHYLMQSNYQFAAVSQLTTEVLAGHDVSKIICLTFDDGYEDNYQYVFPILKKLGIKATFFPIVGPCKDQSVLPLDIYYQCVDMMQLDDVKREDWIKGNKKKRFYFTDPKLQTRLLSSLFQEIPSGNRIRVSYMTGQQLRELSDCGFEIGSHSISHPMFTSDYMDKQRIRDELDQSKDWLKLVTGKTVRSFCFPNGRYDFNCVQLAKEAGYDSVCLVQRNDSTDLKRLPIPAYERIIIKPDSMQEFILEMSGK